MKHTYSTFLVGLCGTLPLGCSGTNAILGVNESGGSSAVTTGSSSAITTGGSSAIANGEGGAGGTPGATGGTRSSVGDSGGSNASMTGGGGAGGTPAVTGGTSSGGGDGGGSNASTTGGGGAGGTPAATGGTTGNDGRDPLLGTWTYSGHVPASVNITLTFNSDKTFIFAEDVAPANIPAGVVPTGCVTTDTYLGTYAETVSGGTNTITWTFTGGTANAVSRCDAAFVSYESAGTPMTPDAITSYRDEGLIPPPTDNYVVTSTTLVLTNPAYSGTIGIGHSPGTTFTKVIDCRTVDCPIAACDAGSTSVTYVGTCCPACSTSEPTCASVTCVAPTCPTGYSVAREPGACCDTCVATPSAQTPNCEAVDCGTPSSCLLGYVVTNTAWTCCPTCAPDPNYCQSDADCMLAWDMTSCCSCNSISTRRYDQDPCYFSADNSAHSASCANAANCTASCPSCALLGQASPTCSNHHCS